MSEDRRTKAQLLEALEQAELRLVNALERLDKVPPAPNRVPEADALAACIRALDALAAHRSPPRDYISYSVGYSGEALPEINRRDQIRESAVLRVIEALGVKYGLPVDIKSAVSLSEEVRP